MPIHPSVSSINTTNARILNALMRFGMGIRLTPEEQDLVAPAESNCSRQLTAINDVWSFDKEVIAAKNLDKEGGALCNAVSILADEVGISIPASKRMLYHIGREYELKHIQLTEDILKHNDSPKIQTYLKGLEYQMSGNEAWSHFTHRYIATNGN